MKRRTLRDHCRCGGVLVYLDAGSKGFHFVCLSCDRDHYFKDTAFLGGRARGAGLPPSAPTGGTAA